MTRRTRTSHEAENRLAALEGGREHAGEIYVISIGGDPDKPRGWVSPEEYEQHYGETSDSDFTFNIESGDS